MADPATILVTGNLGYVGPSVVARLHASYPDATLLGLDAGLFAHCLTGCTALPEHPLAAQHYCDVRTVDPRAARRRRRRGHLAAVSNDPIGNIYDEVHDRHQRTRVDPLAELAKAAGARLVRGRLG